MGKDPSSRSDEQGSGRRLPFNRRKVLASAGTAVFGVGAIGAFSETVAAWDEFAVEFKGCSAVWIIVADSDLEFGVGAGDPLFVNVVVERDGEAVCEKVEFTKDTATTIPGQYGDRPVVKFDGGGDKILAVIKYNQNQFALCYTENENRCAHTPNTVDWREADCYDDLDELDSDRFNNPCSEQVF